jgi:hypothetical protein
MKKALYTAAILGGMMMTAPASAAIYTYETNIGNGIGQTQVTIDTTAQTATFAGNNINLVMSDSNLSSWTPDLSTYGSTYRADSMTGTFTRNGITYNAYFSSSPKHTQFRLGDNYSFLWMYGRDQWGRIFDFDGKGTSTTYTSTTGGSTTSGTPVPAPGALGLLGLGLAALGFGRFGRRRRKATALAAA